MKVTAALQIGVSLAVVLALHYDTGLAADSRFEIDLNELPKTVAPPAKRIQTPHPAKTRAARAPAKSGAADGSLRHYTVKPGDHIFKILMRDFGLSNQQAEQLIPDIVRLNGIGDIRRLRVGQELQIPLAPSSRGSRRSDSKQTARHEAAPPLTTEPLTVAEQPAPAAVTTVPAEPETAAAIQPAPAPPPTNPPEPETVKTLQEQSPPPAAPPAKPERVVVSPVTARDRDGIIDAVLDLLAPGWVRNRIVEGGRDSTDGSYVSIKVNRYFEHLGYRYIVNSESDPLTLTLLRLLEVQGDRVVNVGRDEQATAVAARLATRMGLPQQEGDFKVNCLDTGGGELTVRGIRISPAGHYGQQLLITGDQAPKCTAELLAGAETPLAVK
jgi:hypothetical protein